ncbi:lethal (3) 02640 [Carabus blaptoides fortunei]
MSGDKKIRVGSRKSELALIQTRHVITLLSEIHSDKEFEIVTMSTLGDKVLDIPLPKIGEKSLFTKELETALATGCVDFVVHSLKDLPTTLPEGMAIGAVLEREDPRDALVAKKDSTISCLNDLKPNSVIGTSSLRRTAQLAKTHPHLKVESIRGNLNTRMRKLDELDKFSAIILAAAGLCRMGWNERVTKVLKCNEMLYAVGQGALAVECREGDIETLNLLQPLHCPKTLLRILAERSFLRTLGGGCSTPVAVSTKLVPCDDKLSLELTGGVWSLDGSTELKDHDKCTVEVKPINTDTSKSTEAVCPLGYTKDLADPPYTYSVQQPLPDKYEQPPKLLKCPYEASPCKKLKLDNGTVNITKDVLAIDDPHQHCPVSIPVGLDFMGKCPYLDSHEEGKCPVNGEIQNLIGQHSAQNVTKCPFLKDGKIILSENFTATIAEKKTMPTPMVCPYREPKLYCGLVPSKRTPLWALEQAEHLGMNLAEKLLKSGALEVMQAAQAQIRASN